MLNLDWRPPVLETPRLIIRPIEPADAEPLFLFCSNPKMTRFTLWNTHQSMNDSRSYVNDYPFSRYFNQEPEPLAIVLKEDPTRALIGTIGCFWSSKNDGVMEIGYNLAEPYWGRGLIVEAARRLIDHVFQTYPVERIQARVFVGNDASARAALKMGMSFEGIGRSVLAHRSGRVSIEYYSMLRTEWKGGEPLDSPPVIT